MLYSAAIRVFGALPKNCVIMCSDEDFKKIAFRRKSWSQDHNLEESKEEEYFFEDAKDFDQHE